MSHKPKVEGPPQPMFALVTVEVPPQFTALTDMESYVPVTVTLEPRSKGGLVGGRAVMVAARWPKPQEIVQVVSGLVAAGVLAVGFQLNPGAMSAYPSDMVGKSQPPKEPV